MHDQKRRTFRPRNQRSGSFRPRSNNGQTNGHFNSNGNGSMSRSNGSMTNPFNVEKNAQRQKNRDTETLWWEVEKLSK